MPELYRTQPDQPPQPAADAGIHAWPAGSFMPLGFYRPVPIVRFTATIVLQGVAQLVLLVLLSGLPGMVTIAACALLAVVLARRAFARWLAQASAGWKVVTLAALAFNLALPVIASLPPAGRVRDAALALDAPDEPVIRHHFRPGAAALAPGAPLRRPRAVPVAVQV